MRRHLPPLNGLRAFEAAARHLSFVQAAEELAVTPGAVSHQVKLLEEFLGVQLFRRQARGVRMTEAAQDALPQLVESFDGLERVTDRLTAHRCAGALIVSVAPSFAAKWLVPRIEDFHARFPDIDVRVDAAKRVIDFAREDVDVAIRYGAGETPGLRAWRLFAEPDEIFPVCSPRLIGGDGVADPQDALRNHLLLHADWSGAGATSPSWIEWLEASGVRDIDGTKGPRFSTWALAIQAAVEGQGITLASRYLVADELNDGRLIRPFETVVRRSENVGFHVVCPESAAARPKVKAFCEWVVDRSLQSGFQET